MELFASSSTLFVDVYEDSYEEGELGHVNSYETNVRLHGPAVPLPEFVKLLEKETGHQGWVLFTANGVWEFTTDWMENEDGDEPSAREMEAWRRGEQMLFVAHGVVRAQITTEEITPDNFDEREVANIAGVELV